jgi:hypothetical protein
VDPFSTWWRAADNTGPDLPSEASLFCAALVWAEPLRLQDSVVSLLVRHWGTLQAGHTTDPPWVFALQPLSPPARQVGSAGRDFGKSCVQDFESRLGVIVEAGLGRVRGAWRRTSQTRLGGSSSARAIVASSSRSGMTGTLRSGAEMVHSDSAITARLSSLLMPRPSEAQNKPRKRDADDRKNRHGA